MNSEFNLIINLGGQGWQTEALKERILSNQDLKTKEVFILNIKTLDANQPPSPEELDVFKKINQNSRVYIIDHGTPNSSTISSTHYQELADFIVKRMSKQQILDKQEEKLRFSLIACHAAVGGENSEKSFALLFHRYLGQFHHINADVMARTQVVMVNEHIKSKGKLTTSLAHYGLIIKAHELGLPKIFYDLSKSTHKYHQTPGSKLTFRWNNKGKEFVIDSYVDKFIKKTNNLTQVLFMLETQVKSGQWAEIKTHLIAINELCQHIEELDGKDIYQIRQHLKQLDELVKNSSIDPESKESIIGALSVLIKFASTVDKNKPVVRYYDADIKDFLSYEMDPMRWKIKSELIDSSIIELKKMPKTELEKPLKKQTTSFLQSLSDKSYELLKYNRSNDREKAMSEFVKMTLSTINSNQLTKEEKLTYIEGIKESLLKAICDEIVISPWLHGLLEGVDEAQKFGGLTTLKFLLPLIKLRSEETSKKLEKDMEAIESFSERAISYLKITSYQGIELDSEQVLSEQAKELAYEFNLNLYEAVVQTNVSLANFQMDLLSQEDIPLTSKEELGDRISLNINIMSEMEKKLKKIKFSLEHSPKNEMAIVFMDIVVKETENKLNELEKLTMECMKITPFQLESTSKMEEAA
jgi:hypothetical protein